MSSGYSLVYDKRQLSNLNRLLKKFPEDWQRDQVSMAIFRKASQPVNAMGRASLEQSVPNLAMDGSLIFRSKVDKTKTIMRVGLVNKGKGRLGHLFNFGTGERRTSSGKSTGRIDKSKFGSGWWDKIVPLAKTAVESEIDKIAPSIISRYVRKYMT